jgi:NitT/TauT family transport system ATP-binding protein
MRSDFSTPSLGEAAVGIELSHLTVKFSGSGQDVVALEDISLRVTPSEFICLIGPSGCGKTTLLNVIADFVKATAGTVSIGEANSDKKRLTLGVVFQEYALFPWRTALRNVEFGLEMQGMPAAERRHRALQYLDLLGLAAFADAYPHTLSGGMKQRVAIARALAYDPGILLMDEPFGALDSFTRDELQKLLVEIWQRTRKTILYVTHNIVEAVYLAERVVVLTPHPGRIRSIVQIDLPRPRDPLSGGFVDVQRELTRRLNAPPHPQDTGPRYWKEGASPDAAGSSQGR